MSAEHGRLENPKQWRAWGPYVASRQWGTVREDYSANGDAWNYFPFDHAHQRAYRWGEDGLAGISDADGLLNFSVALHNGKDDRLKERLFGLTNGQGNHGEDVKEYWWPIDATPTHSWASWLYRYPQAAYPYRQLVAENGARSKQEPEFELSDTGVLDHDRFFDISVDHAKADVDDLLITITATNHGPDMAPLELLGQLWFTNTWAWGNDPEIPELRALVIAGEDPTDSALRIAASHHRLGNFVLAAEPHLDAMPTLLFCDNETNDVELYGAETNRTAYPKDGINNAAVHGDFAGVNPQNRGTKAAVRYSFAGIAPGQSVTVRLRLRADSANAVIDGTTRPGMDADFGPAFAATMAQRSHEADSFYAAVIPASASVEDAHVARRAFAGLMWGKQLYRYTVEDWLEGDPAQPPPPPERKQATGAVPGRNTRWRNLDLAHVISMPDEWEYPWFAAWDLAFHTVPLAHIDPAFAKDQLLLLCREFVLHPDGQLPAYEWAFGDVNPPVHAWAAWQIYTLDGSRDTKFLLKIFSKLLLNFSWWVNRKDADGNHLFEGGFLGMDNIGLFDRSAPMPPGYRLEQSDASSWMAFYALGMLRIALELASTDPSWEDMASYFLGQFFGIADAMENFGYTGNSLWNEDDGFFYDVLLRPDGTEEQLRVRSMVGLMPLLAVTALPEWATTSLPAFAAKLARLSKQTDHFRAGTLALLEEDRRQRVLKRLLDPAEFLSDHGIRALSAAYREPFSVDVDGRSMTMAYLPGVSDSGLFGGNSNWRGPVWFPVNALLVGALTELGYRAEAEEIKARLTDLYRPGERGRRPGTPRDFPSGPLWDPHPVFSEYFHGDTGEGLGATHQTGWSAFVAHFICSPSGRG